MGSYALGLSRFTAINSRQLGYYLFINITEFIEVPSPPIVTVTLKETHVYTCNHSETERISWRVNDSVSNDEIFPPQITPNIIAFPDGGRVYALTIIGGRPEHNATTYVLCNNHNASYKAENSF